MSVSETVTGARRALGDQLAALRGAAGYTQTQFAPLVGYSRSTIANVEAGSQQAAREFWERCDSVLSTDTSLVRAHDEIDSLIRDGRRRAATAAEHRRRERLAQASEPAFPHYTVDNRLNAAVALADQAQRIARRVLP